MKKRPNTIEEGNLLLSGNEAVARGAWEYGVHFAAAYPGTPSTEILESIGEEYDEIDAQWAPNEKVGLEVIAGASFAGARVLSAMKHVGLNVAADPLFTLSYIGATGGIVIVSADDPGMHSSQNEQDNRLMGKAAKVVILEPSDSQEAKDMVGEGLRISEDFDTPVLLRMTTRICHSKSMVKVGPRTEVPVKGYVGDIKKRVPIPAHARAMHSRVEKRLKDISVWGSESSLNRIEEGDTALGIITSGVSYQYVKEASPEASVLKIGISNPLPWDLIEKFISMVDRVVFVEENEPYLEENIKARFLIQADGKNIIPIEGELNPEIVRNAVHPGTAKKITHGEIQLPARPPALCPGCPHRGAFYCLSKLGGSSTGDIGCYTLGMMPPHNALETTVCMGASIGVLSGIEKAVGRKGMGKLVAAIGESTFVHSGITGLIDMVYNGNTGTVMIMDNSLTAMTGGQENPTTGKTLRGEPAPVLDLESVVAACGVKHVIVVDPHDLPEMQRVLKEELDREELSVIITRRPCVMNYRPKKRTVAELDPEKCIGCKACMNLGCPAISWDGERPEISKLLCWPNCNMCVQVCPVDALSKDMGGLQ
ncbi:indolepyruvate ferredoxin oxidoreductase subunit alpha [Candidatus Eisenbacteria bacterium]|uniref:Indolepyruvate oxidoreductase subunit IorA n=1 Tax=Eiseniibacteriota bacterium TaxID=2212470 RepID=A0ABV6YPP1_UNCEI